MGTDMDKELEPSRKGLFQKRVDMADSHCLSAHEILDALCADLLELGGYQQPPYAKKTRRELKSAGMELGLALACIGATRHIALRGGAAPSSSVPLESVDDLAGDPDVRRALGWLEKAEVLATDAHDRVQAARSRLRAAALLRFLNDEGGGDEDARDAAPWEHSPCVSERLDGIIEISLALSKAVDLVQATVAASKAASGSSGSTG